VTLTVGQGPFGHRPAGRFNFDVPAGVVYLEDSPRWLRAELGGETVIDSRSAKVLHEHGRLPVYLFPATDVALARIPEDAVRRHDDDLVEVRWDALDRWLEEGEEIVVHMRDPYHRIDVLDTPRRVRVTLGGELLADSTRARVLFEASLPPRWYLPAEDVRMELLTPSPVRTGCAYKGFARYFDVRAGDRVEEALVWTYPDPRHDAERVRDRLCFFDERVDVEIDGEPQERPLTPWSSRADPEDGVTFPERDVNA
jgi:uncharacterized protein (DUF427 family)